MAPVIIFLSTIQPFFGYKGFTLNSIRVPIDLMLFLIIAIALFSWAFIEKGIDKIDKTCFIFFIFWISLTVLMTIIGLLTVTVYYGSYTMDLGTFILFAGGIIFSNKLRLIFLIKILIFCAILAIIVGIYSLFFIDFNLTSVYERSLNTWQLPYFCWRLLDLWPILLFAAVFYKKKYSFIAITVSILYLILGLSFLKRNIFFQMIVFSAIVMIGIFGNKAFYIEKIKNTCIFIIKIILFLAILLIIVNLFLPDVYQKISILTNLTFERIQDQDFSSFNRFDEIKGMFKDFDTFQVIFGKGIGKTQNYLGFPIPIYHIHIGWGNLIFKGGILLFLYFFLSFFIILKKLFSKKINGLTRVSISTITYLFLVMLIDTIFWGISATTLLFGAFFFYSINYSIKLDNNKKTI
jgi:hypothetical protein